MTIYAGRTHFLPQFVSTDMDIKTMFWDPNKVTLDRFEVSMNPINTPIAFKLLKKNVWSSTTVLTNVTTFGVAAGATVLAVEVAVEVGYQRHRYLYCIVAHAQGFQNHIIWAPNSSIRVRYKGLMLCRNFDWLRSHCTGGTTLKSSMWLKRPPRSKWRAKRRCRVLHSTSTFKPFERAAACNDLR